MKENNIKKDMEIYEASDFWDEHDFDETGDFKEVSDMKFELQKKKYIGINNDLYLLIKQKAQELHKPEDTLVNEWLNRMAGV